MAKYEIMLVLAPGEDLAVAEKIAKDVFGAGVQKVEKLERTELAYPINKSKTGQFVILNVETEETNVAEFTRRTNIQKTIWRTLVINLDSEKGLNRKAKPKKVKAFPRRNFNRESNVEAGSMDERAKRTRTVRKTADNDESTEAPKRAPRVKKEKEASN